MRNVYVLYVNHVRSGEVENIGQYNSCTEASQMIASHVDKLAQEKKLIIDRNCTPDNALTKIKDEKYIVKNTQLKTEIYIITKKKGFVYNSYNYELLYTIGIMEVLFPQEMPMPMPIPTPPPPPPSTPNVKRAIIKPPKLHMLSDSYMNELKLAVSTFQNKKILGFQNKKVKVPELNIDDILKKFK